MLYGHEAIAMANAKRCRHPLPKVPKVDELHETLLTGVRPIRIHHAPLLRELSIAHD